MIPCALPWRQQLTRLPQVHLRSRLPVHTQ
jgi:hypothetical protein